MLGAALRGGSLESGNLYVTHTELHELLAQAFERAGEADSAAAHYARVADAWRSADPQFRARRDEAARRAAELLRLRRRDGDSSTRALRSAQGPRSE